MNLFKILIGLFSIISFCFSMDLVQKDLNEKNFSINKGSFKVAEFEKMVKNIKVSNEANIEIDFIDDNYKPLQAIKIFGKEVGTGNILVTFVDNSTMHININIVENLSNIIVVAKQISPELIIEQTKDKIILKGDIQDQKSKDVIINLFRKANIEIKDQLIDLTTVKNPDKMIRIKLYVVEIDNSKKLDIKNEWGILGFREGKTISDNDEIVFPNNISTTSISGGLTSIANIVGSDFNVGIALQYLKTKDIAEILDETTLITLEKNQSKFHSGGTINARVATGDTVQFTQIQYGLKMIINVEEIIDSKYVKLLINTESSTLDANTKVDEIPAIINKTIDTNVIVGNLSTIVLGGLINIGSANSEQKIPLLGDIPLLGKLFTSSSTSTDNKELVFFVTPEIVDPKENEQGNTLKEKTTFTNEIRKDYKIETKSNLPSETNSEHEKKVKELLGN